MRRSAFYWNWNMRNTVCLAFLVMIFPLSRASWAGDGSEIANSFKITVKAKSVLESESTKKEMVVNLEIHYTWMRKGQDRTLTFDLLKMQVADDGEETLNTTMNRKKFGNVIKGELKETAFADAPPALKAILKDGFESPICVLRVDDTGKEIERKVVAGPGAKSFIDNGQIANALTFHPPFFKDKEKWDAPAEFPIGKSGFARGRLSYQKKSADRQKVVFQVTGVLTSKITKKLNELTLSEEWRYEIKGEQEYDLASREWTAGKMAIDTKMEITPDKGSPVVAKGTMDVTFERFSK
jgi:hypothetical protein